MFLPVFYVFKYALKITFICSALFLIILHICMFYFLKEP